MWIVCYSQHGEISVWLPLRMARNAMIAGSGHRSRESTVLKDCVDLCDFNNTARPGKFSYKVRTRIARSSLVQCVTLITVPLEMVNRVLGRSVPFISQYSRDLFFSACRGQPLLGQDFIIECSRSDSDITLDRSPLDK